MLVILITVLSQGPLVDSDLRGSLKGLLFVNSGFFQAVGVISFGLSSFTKPGALLTIQLSYAITTASSSTAP
jgi:solute carrier family 38 (sodium-coupled neutral amino acid transporter), member 11